MKKKYIILTILIVVFFFTSVEMKNNNKKHEVYKIKFVIYYPTSNDTVVIKSKCKLGYACEEGVSGIYENPDFVNPKRIFETTAPIKVLSKTKE